MTLIKFSQNFQYSAQRVFSLGNLAHLDLSYPASQKISQSIAGKQSLADLFAVSLQNLDAEAELRRFFGAKVVLASKAGESSKGKKGPGPNVKSHLTRPQPTWWAASGREGLSLRQLPDEEAEEKCKRHSWEPMQEKWWTVEYSKKYKSMTKAFMDTVLSGGQFTPLSCFLWLKLPRSSGILGPSWCSAVACGHLTSTI